MFRVSIFILCTIICAGCGKPTTLEMRTEHASQMQFHVTGSIQTVIKQILDKNNECQYAARGHITVIDELGEAYIEYGGRPGTIFILVDLRRENENTRVNIYTSNKMFDHAAKTLEYGAKNLPGCP